MTKKRKVLRAKPGNRVWMTRGLKDEHYEGIRKVASFMPRIIDPVSGKQTSGTIQAAHDYALGLGLVEAFRALGIPFEDERPPAA